MPSTKEKDMPASGPIRVDRIFPKKENISIDKQGALW